jgi:hypothetical protein
MRAVKARRHIVGTEVQLILNFEAKWVVSIKPQSL